MVKNRTRSGAQKPLLFSPKKRKEILDRVLTALRTDHRIAGVLIVGSGATDFEDRYSDVDLSVVVAKEKDLPIVYGEWRNRIEKLLPVIHCCEVTYSPNSYLYAFLIEGFLELDLGFVCLDSLFAKRERWKVAFDRSGKIQDIMRSSWEKRPQPDIRTGYLNRINGIWHYVIHVPVALKRGQPWMALHYLEIIRNRTVELAGLRRRLDTGNFRQVDQMPEQFLAELQRTLVSGVNPADIMRALKMAVMCFFREAQGLDEKLGLDVARNLELKMCEYLTLFQSKTK